MTGARETRGAALAAAAIALAALLAYAPALSNGFVNWDDDRYVTGNAAVRGVSWANVRWAFTTLYESNWHPLTWLSHMLDGSLFNANAGGHHATSVLIHAANAVLLLFVLRRMTGRLAPSAIVAALFALHPLNVESVAWVSERKNVLSTLFMILAIGAYARYVERPSRAHYAAVAILFALGLMAKPMLVTLPFVFLLLDVWPLRRTSALRERLIEKLPLFALSAASCVVTLIAQRPARVAMTIVPLGDRVLNAALSYAGYIAKTIAPVGLSPYYSLPGTPEAAPIRAPLALGAIAALAVATLLAWRARRGAPHRLVGWLWYLGTLVPVIGLVQVGGQAMADRYAYVPLIGIFIAVAWSLPLGGAQGPAPHAGVARAAPAWARGLALSVALACVVAAALAFATARQTRVWRDSDSLWRRALAENPRCRLALTNLGIDLVDRGRSDEGIALFERALEVDPAYAHARVSLGGALTRLDRLDEAILHLEAAVAQGTTLPEGPFNLGLALGRAGRAPEACRAFEAAIALDPSYAKAHAQLGTFLARDGRSDEAIDHFRQALALAPNDPDTHVDFGVALASLGRRAEAIAEYETALSLSPSDATALQNFGNVLADAGDFDGAITRYRAAAAIDTASAPLRYNLALAFLQMGDFSGAEGALREALVREPAYAEAYYTLGIVHARRAENDAAIAAFAEAARLRPNYGEALVNRGALLASAGRAREAESLYVEAVRVQPANVQAYQNLGLLRLGARRYGDAIDVFRAGVRVAPEHTGMLNALAWLRATCPNRALRDGAEAVALAERVVAASARRDPNALDTLGAAYAEAGRFDDARRVAEEGAALARSSGDAALADEIDGHARGYARGVAHRMPK
ncbi:MAG: tetratricopeptide repeat protein [bacterium]